MNPKTTLITGASHGIGKAIAARFAAEGCHLILNCKHDVDKLQADAKQLQSRFGVRTLVLPCDVSSHREVCRMFAQALDVFGGVDILVNNAGISYIGLLTDMTIDDWNHVISTNLTSVFSCCHEAVPHMVRRQSGRIINISSVWGRVGASCEAAYSASKGGVDSLTKALARELAPSHIPVNAIACGVIDTRMNGCFDAAERAGLEAEIPMGRYGSPSEIADLAWQLATAPLYLTGQILTIDGGWQ